MSSIWQLNFDTEDLATRYQNGILSDLEGLAIKRFKNGFGIGGFVGRAFGIGPIVTYSTKLGKSHLDFSARWIHDFDVADRVAGDGFSFSGSLKF